MKVVLNKCYGVFQPSELFYETYNIKKDEVIERTDKRLIEFVELDNTKASSQFSNLMVEEIENGKTYRIIENDGFEEIQYPEDIIWSIACD